MGGPTGRGIGKGFCLQWQWATVTQVQRNCPAWPERPVQATAALNTISQRTVDHKIAQGPKTSC
eukprot:7196348-Alexandrium_andersonii.AAC.1